MSKRSRRKQAQQKQYLIGAAILLALIAFIVIINQNSSNTQLVSELPLEISAQEAYTYRENGAFILDVRTQDEWNAGHIPDATLIPLNELPDRLDEIPQGVEIIVICNSGNRSDSGRDILLEAGFPAVTSVNGGVIEWQALGYPFE
jgi:rhodanese-related sulfurtransferase